MRLTRFNYKSHIGRQISLRFVNEYAHFSGYGCPPSEKLPILPRLVGWETHLGIDYIIVDTNGESTVLPISIPPCMMYAEVSESPAPAEGESLYRGGTGEGTEQAKLIEKDVLSEAETDFLRMIYINPGSRIEEGAYAHTENEDGTFESIALWHRLEKLGYIESVGSYKWILSSNVVVSFSLKP